MIQKLPKAHQNAAEILSRQVEEMSQNQLKSYLRFLTENEPVFNTEIRMNLKKVSEKSDFPFGYLIIDFLTEKKN